MINEPSAENDRLIVTAWSRGLGERDFWRKEIYLGSDSTGFGDSSGNALTLTPLPRDDTGREDDADKVGEEKYVARRGQEQQDCG